MVARLGELERAIMEVLWSADGPCTARQIAEALPTREATREATSQTAREPNREPTRELAKTTVLTVLSRLEKKSRVVRSRDEWAHTYRPKATREDYVAELMYEALGDAGDRTAALARFVDQVSADDAQALQAALASAERS